MDAFLGGSFVDETPIAGCDTVLPSFFPRLVSGKESAAQENERKKKEYSYVDPFFLPSAFFLPVCYSYPTRIFMEIIT